MKQYFLASFADEIQALRDTWLVGDTFLEKNYDGLQNLKTRWELKHQQTPYIYQFYNVSAYYMNPLSDVRPSMARMQNALVKAMNKNTYLPKYLIMLPDMDLVESIIRNKLREDIEDILNWIINQVSKLLITRREDLKYKNPGSVTADLTRVIWVKMLARPNSNSYRLQKIWRLKNKYNEILTFLLEAEKYMHIIELKNMEEYKYFDKQGNLSTAGKAEFWANFNKELKITDSMRKPETNSSDKKTDKETSKKDVTKEQRESKKKEEVEVEKYFTARRQLPMPPPRTDRYDRHRRNEYREYHRSRQDYNGTKDDYTRDRYYRN